MSCRASLNRPRASSVAETSRARAEQGRAMRDYSNRRLETRSAQPSLADHAGDLFTDQPLDDAGEMVVEPGLQ